MISTCKLLFIIQLCFILCNYLHSISADAQKKFYHANTTKIISLEPSSIKVIITFIANMYIKQAINDHNSLIFEASDFVSEMKIGDKVINLFECESLKNHAEVFHKPTRAIFNSDGLLDRLIVDKNEIVMITNLRMDYLYYLQNQIQSLLPKNQKEFSILYKVTEPTSFGNCSVTYDVTKEDLMNDHEEIFMKKSYGNLKTCLKKNNKDIFKSDEEYFLSHCASTSEENYDWNIDVTCEKELSGSLPGNFNVSEYISYKPFKNQPTVFEMNHLTEMRLLPPQDYEISDLVELDTKVITKTELPKINKDILNKDLADSKAISDLKEVYAALSCSSVDRSELLGFLEAAILCKS